MTSKWDVVRALKESGLPGPVRQVIRLILDEVDAETCRTTDAHPVSIGKLEKWSGLGRSTVIRALDTAEETRWVERDRPETREALGEFATTHYHVMIGKTVVKEKRKRPSTPSATEGLGPEGDHPSADAELGSEPSVRAGLGSERDQGRPTEGLGVVPERDHPSARAGHIIQPPTGVESHYSHQSPLNPLASSPSADAADVPPLPGFETTEKAPVKPKRAHRRPYGNADFDAFFEVYPRKDDPKKAWGAWQTAVKAVNPEHQADLIAEIIAGAERYRDDPNRSDQYTKLATTWLNAGSWANGPLPARNGRSASAPDNRAVSTAEAIETGWNRKARTQ